MFLTLSINSHFLFYFSHYFHLSSFPFLLFLSFHLLLLRYKFRFVFILISPCFPHHNLSCLFSTPFFLVSTFYSQLSSSFFISHSQINFSNISLLNMLLLFIFLSKYISIDFVFTVDVVGQTDDICVQTSWSHLAYSFPQTVHCFTVSKGVTPWCRRAAHISHPRTQLASVCLLIVERWPFWWVVDEGGHQVTESSSDLD